MDPYDPLVFCPFDATHQIRKSILQTHLTKCSRQHTNTTKRYCPFNRTHVYDQLELQAHINECPDSVNVQLDKYEMEPGRTIGVPIQEVATLEVPSTENWDEEPAPLSSYDPLENIQNRNVLQVKMTLSKAQRKKFRQAERQRFRSLPETSEEPQPTTSTASFQEDINKPLRTPQRCMKAASSESKVLKASTANNSSLNEQKGAISKKDTRAQTNITDKSLDEISAGFNNLKINKTGQNTTTKNSGVTESSKSVDKVLKPKTASGSRNCSGHNSSTVEFKGADENTVPLPKANRKSKQL